ncbi:hypothetical protein KIPB_002117 [Kipferlia bialata]|uniref:Uncharacterized protein n=1 Tax=Kipferlia bialata TaxID=797122 RepID=A0A9K3CQZ8_9EUKA|nr:hypothetical protein KIPB_002117 [Kipferlia bialata]|eukprot:g2117.t1
MSQERLDRLIREKLASGSVQSVYQDLKHKRISASAALAAMEASGVVDELVANLSAEGGGYQYQCQGGEASPWRRERRAEREKTAGADTATAMGGRGGGGGGESASGVPSSGLGAVPVEPSINRSQEGKAEEGERGTGRGDTLPPLARPNVLDRDRDVLDCRADTVGGHPQAPSPPKASSKAPGPLPSLAPMDMAMACNVIGTGAVLVVDIVSMHGFHSLADEDAGAAGAVVGLHMSVGSSRARTEFCPASMSPSLTGQYCLALPTHDTDTLLTMHSPLRLCMTRADTAGSSSVVGTASINWRQCLVSGRASVSVSLSPEHSVQPVAGIVDLTLSIPNIRHCTQEEVSAADSALEASLASEAQAYRREAETWYQEYTGAGDGFGTRLVQLYADSECSTPTPLCLYGQAQPCPLPSPNHCIRCVSLLSLSSTSGAGRRSRGMAGQPDLWRSQHTVLSACCGTPTEHALLLTGLLRGYCLEAYTCLGRLRVDNAPHAFVLVDEGEGSSGVYRCIEPVTGVSHMLPGQASPCACIESVFCQDGLYACTQRSTRVEGLSLCLSDPTCWKRFTPPPMPVSMSDRCAALHPGDPSASSTVQAHLTDALWGLIAARRADVNLSTPHNLSLSHLLSAPLVAYEAERLAGSRKASFGNALFAAGVKRILPEGAVFAAFPLQVQGTLRLHAPAILAAMLRHHKGRQILEARGDSLGLGLSVLVRPYADRLDAVWVVVAAVYVPVDGV